MSEGVATRRKLRQQRGLNLADAAFYVGISPELFTRMVEDGRMPPPKLIEHVRRWDVESLDIYFEALPDDLRTAPQRRPKNYAGVGRRPVSSTSDP